MLVYALPLLLAACGQSGPVFSGISAVKVRHMSTGGLSSTDLTGADLKAAVQCLGGTTEIAANDADELLLTTTYLLVIRDRMGDRNFELYTENNLKGNKNKYYANPCIHKIVVKAMND